MDLVVINQPRLLPYQMPYQIVKRVIDVALCLLILPLALPLMAICALAIYFDSVGPIFFVQERVGKGGRPFSMYKFRTLQVHFNEDYHWAFMKAFVRGEVGNNTDIDSRRAFIKAFVRGSDILLSPESSSEPLNKGSSLAKNRSPIAQTCDEGDDQEIHKPIKASQITRVGRILRKTSLDELPQLINVLKGEMSLVGPRPNVPYEVKEYQPWHHERLEVLPGITGLAQVRGRSTISFDRIVRYDIEYIEKQSLGMDLEILWWTVWSVIANQGAK